MSKRFAVVLDDRTIAVCEFREEAEMIVTALEGRERFRKALEAIHRGDALPHQIAADALFGWDELLGWDK
jgi:hypothetical protein